MKTQIVSAIIAVFFTAPLFAQQMVVTEGGTTFGIRAGVNFSTINGKSANDSKLDNGIKTGFHGGLNAEIPVGSGFYAQPGVLFSQKGAEWSDNVETKFAYIEVPVNLVYKPVLGTGNLLLGFGPYVGFAVGGKTTVGSTDIEHDYDADYNAMNPATYYKSLDAGANFLAGYEFAGNLSFQINAGLGLVNVNKSAGDNDNTKYRNTSFGLSLGYRF